MWSTIGSGGPPAKWFHLPQDPILDLGGLVKHTRAPQSPPSQVKQEEENLQNHMRRHRTKYSFLSRGPRSQPISANLLRVVNSGRDRSHPLDTQLPAAANITK